MLLGTLCSRWSGRCLASAASTGAQCSPHTCTSDINPLTAPMHLAMAAEPRARPDVYQAP